jgi:hypothetical protein
MTSKKIQVLNIKMQNSRGEEKERKLFRISLKDQN